MIRNIALLGSTGSIGQNTLEVVRENRDKYNVVSLVCGNNLEVLRNQINEFSPSVISVEDQKDSKILSSEFPDKKIFSGSDGIIEAVMEKSVDTVITATTGTIALEATLESIKKGHRICLANKETMVAAGELVNKYLENSRSQIIPIDSEQSAVFQALCEKERKYLKKVILTASGGPFFKVDRSEFNNIGVEDALNHPVWSMGSKVTIDSATLMNKALEIIEAYYLFKLNPDQIDVIIHPQSIIHSMVEFFDTSILAQMSLPDMKLPIQYSLSYPERLDGLIDNLELAKVGKMEFFEVDRNKFSSIEMAYRVLEEGKNSGTVFNAANEVAVDYFLDNKISFNDIFNIVRKMLNYTNFFPVKSVDEINSVIGETKVKTIELIETKKYLKSE
ncbi:MAG: 1-deoxy-D-xylulose-5-phosphate reductoisomerase [Acidobacteriota bacterium]